MSLLVLDTETTGATNGTRGNPFSSSNRLCYVGVLRDNEYADFNIEYDYTPYGAALDAIRASMREDALCIGFNLKFDLHWLRRYGCPIPKRIWDCQIVEYVLSKQKLTYPSLEETAANYGLPGKLDIVKTEYWEKGFDTDQVPEEVLRDYLEQDVQLTWQVYLKQKALVDQLPHAQRMLINLMFQDLLVLQEMEWNGLKYDFEQSEQRAKELEAEREKLEADLIHLSGYDFINWNSNRHLSCLLYGGAVKEEFRETYEFVYADGRTKPKERWAERVHVLPALAVPLRGAELQPGKDGQKYWSTDEGNLRKLKVNAKTRKLIDTLLAKKVTEKLVGTYYRGIPTLAEDMQWVDGYIHGQLNSCVTDTGRLASSKPNQQNFPNEFRQCITTRYGK